MEPDRYSEHMTAVAGLTAAFAALPADVPVRLAKSTSNLFRFRAAGPGLDVGAFDHVLSVDPVARTADVQGMVTYEQLVDATLPHGLMPFVVPQLKTITLGGAVVGLGIESSSVHAGLVHESVLELEILTGDGRVVVARRDNEHADLFRAFPNSYGTLGYALRVTIELAPVQPFVRLEHRRFTDADACFAAMAELTGSDFLDGVVFGPDELYLTVGTFAAEAPWVSDYTGMEIFYRSIQTRTEDYLTIRDYLWRWDTDWFWCSRAFGVQNPLVRRLWPGRYRRSDVYRKLVALDRRHRISERLTGRKEEPVVQDVEVPVGRGAEFLEFFHREIGIAPIWLCPLRLRDANRWPLYPLDPGELWVNVGFWSSVPLKPGETEGHYNRLIEDAVAAVDGHKSLYSTVYYPVEEFWRLYNGPVYDGVKASYDGAGRLPDLYDKCVRPQ